MVDPDAEPESSEPLPVWRRRRWQALAVALVLAGGSFAGVSLVQAGDEAEADDGFPRTIPETVYEPEPFPPDEAVFSMGNIDIAAPGAQVQIVKVEPLASPNLEYLGAYVVWPRDYEGGGLSIAAAFPSEILQPKRHAIDEPIPTSETNRVDTVNGSPVPFSVTVGFRVLSGIAGVNGIRVTYRANGETLQRIFPLAVVACLRPGPCLDYSKDLKADRVALRRLDLLRD
ncbi:MAG: hypothetical protein ACT4QF_25245 [Sporichthyaceae bacterium]